MTAVNLEHSACSWGPRPKLKNRVTCALWDRGAGTLASPGKAIPDQFQESLRKTEQDKLVPVDSTNLRLQRHSKLIDSPFFKGLFSKLSVDHGCLLFMTTQGLDPTLKGVLCQSHYLRWVSSTQESLCCCPSNCAGCPSSFWRQDMRIAKHPQAGECIAMTSEYNSLLRTQ